MNFPVRLPILGICGFSGSGKTTLIEALLPRLIERGLRVGVVKHDVHGVRLDAPGTDSDRFFQAGAEVLLVGPGEQIIRRRDAAIFEAAIPLRFDWPELSSRCDLVLVEGLKRLPYPKLWLLGAGEAQPPAEIENVLAVLPRDGDRVEQAWQHVLAFLNHRTVETPAACVLIGGRSTRMGSPKHLLPAGPDDDRCWLERTVELLAPICSPVVIAGRGDVPASLADLPRLPDVPEIAGPMAGLLAAMRWSPASQWLLAGCDYPQLTTEAVAWLLRQRQPGRWAVLPRGLAGDIEPLLAWYDFRARLLIDELAAVGQTGLWMLAGNDRVWTANVPIEFASAWTDVDEPSFVVPPLGGR